MDFGQYNFKPDYTRPLQNAVYTWDVAYLDRAIMPGSPRYAYIDSNCEVSPWDADWAMDLARKCRREGLTGTTVSEEIEKKIRVAKGSWR